MGPTHTVYISAHFVPERISFLSTVLDAVLGWPGCRANVNLVTNSEALQEHETVRGFERRFDDAGSSLRHVIARDLDHPFHLTWHHKRFLQGWRQSAGEGDLFIYLEDDTVLPADGIRYFQKYRPVLQPFGLIPSYIRFERVGGGAPVCVDLVEPEFYGHRNSVRVGDAIAHVCRNPYWAGFILDRELAEEYSGSRSFDIDASRFVQWDVRARAAMGLSFEATPAGFRARHAVVLDRGQPVPGALIWHCANTYAGVAGSRYGRLALSDAFVTGSALAFQVDRVRARLTRSALFARAKSPST